MKETIRTTRSATRKERFQHAELLVKSEEGPETNVNSPHQHRVTSPTDTIVKVEESDVNLTRKLSSRIVGRDSSSHQISSTNYCTVCVRRFSTNSHYRRHLQGALHKKRVNNKLIRFDDEFNQSLSKRHCQVCDRHFINTGGYNAHMNTANHKRMVTWKLTSPKDLPQEFDSSLYCKVCDRKFKTNITYRNHLGKVHKMNLTYLKPKYNFNVDPDPNDSDNYCASCDWTYASTQQFTEHLRKVHSIITKKPAPDPNVIPDIDDPNFYCKSCDSKSKTRLLYRTHLQRVHKMKLTTQVKQPIFDPTISADCTKDQNNTSCVICKFTYSKKDYYEIHMKRVHKNGKITTPVRRIISVTNPAIQPDPTDSNYFCRSCQRQYSSQNVYRTHIRLMHPDVKHEKPPPRPSAATTNPMIVKMDAGNLDNKTCTICEREYTERRNYVKHMKVYHKDGKIEKIIPRNQMGISPNYIPIWDDPSYRCRICKKTYTSKKIYRVHIKKFHDDVLQEEIRLSMSNPTQ